MSLEEALRVEGGQVLATLIRLTGDIGLAEDALQEAMIAAYERWSDDAMPDNAGAWLTTTARNKALDRLRREARRTDKEREAVALLDQRLDDPNEPTDLLRLVFTCCHPSLAPEAQVALALRTLCGLSTTEIASLFLVRSSTMGQRISRAKKKISTARIPYRVPEEHELPDRLPPVLATLYLVFTAGHHATAGTMTSRVDLADEAIRLTRMLAGLMPDEPEVDGLLALMLATHARRAARTAPDGSMILLAHQDRSAWDGRAIEEASLLVERSLRRAGPGEYRLQAAIACLHGMASSYEETDWPQITELYRLLERVRPSPVVRVNRAVAEAETFGVEAGLALLEGLPGVEDWHLYWSTVADLHRRRGDRDAATDAYRAALTCEMNETDRTFIEARLASLATVADEHLEPRAAG